MRIKIKEYEIINNILESEGISKRTFRERICSIVGENIPEQTVYSYLNGTRTIPRRLRKPVAKALNVPIGVIFQDEETLSLVKEYIKNPNEELKNFITYQYSKFDGVISIPKFQAIAGYEALRVCWSN